MARHLAAARHDIATLFNKSSLSGDHHLTAEAKVNTCAEPAKLTYSSCWPTP